MSGNLKQELNQFICMKSDTNSNWIHALLLYFNGLITIIVLNDILYFCLHPPYLLAVLVATMLLIHLLLE